MESAPGKPEEEFLDESMAENERKNEIIGANYAPGGGGTPIHYLYGYVPPNGVVMS